MPERIQRKRTKGWKMPENTVSVTRPGKWGNPYKVGEVAINPYYVDERDFQVRVTPENCLLFFEAHVLDKMAEQPNWLEPLRGKDLACWCKPGQPCHADILLKLANQWGVFALRLNELLCRPCLKP